MAINSKSDAFVEAYVRAPFPQTIEGLNRYIQQELQRIEAFTREAASVTIQVSDTEPSDKRKGMVRFAVSPWFPISSITSGDTGLVVYTGSAWELVKGAS